MFLFRSILEFTGVAYFFNDWWGFIADPVSISDVEIESREDSPTTGESTKGMNKVVLEN